MCAVRSPDRQGSRADANRRDQGGHKARQGHQPRGQHSSSPTDGVLLKGRAYFGAYDGVHSQELWRSDGTAKGTKLVKDINQGDDAWSHLARWSDSATTSISGPTTRHARPELWRSDGTGKGTKLVKDIKSRRVFIPRWAASVSGKEDLLRPPSTLTEAELWRTDGTTKGTKQVKDIVSGPGGRLPYDFTSINGKLLFDASDAVHGSPELWQTDGTAKGTKLLKDIDTA